MLEPHVEAKSYLIFSSISILQKSEKWVKYGWLTLVSMANEAFHPTKSLSYLSSSCNLYILRNTNQLKQINQNDY